MVAHGNQVYNTCNLLLQRHMEMFNMITQGKITTDHDEHNELA
jgi:hypothetical protein